MWLSDFNPNLSIKIQPNFFSHQYLISHAESQNQSSIGALFFHI